MKHRTILALLLLLTALAATSCSAVRECRSPELNLPSTLAEGDADSLTVADLAWWEFYGDPALRRIMNGRSRTTRTCWPPRPVSRSTASSTA